MADTRISGLSTIAPTVDDHFVIRRSALNYKVTAEGVADFAAGRLGLYPAHAYGALGDGVTDDAAAIQDAIDAAEAAGGGDVPLVAPSYALASTLVIDSNSVRLVGQGAAGNVDGSPITHGTMLKWTGGAAPMVRFTATDAGTWPLTHCGMQGITLNCQGVATVGLQIISLRESIFREIFVRNPVTAGITLDVVDTLTNARDAQQNLFEQITIRCVDTGALSAIGILLDGDEDANASYNHFYGVQIHHTNGVAVKLIDADSNVFQGVQCYRVGGGTGIGFELLGATPAVIGGHARYNTFYSCNPGNGGIVARGLTYTNPSDRNSFYDLITSNQALSQTVEPSATLRVETQEGDIYQDGILIGGAARRTMTMKDDFISRLGSSGSVGELGWTVATGAVTQIAAADNHPGISRLSTGTGDVYAAMHVRGGATTGILDADEDFDLLAIIRINTSDANTLCRIGLGNGVATNPPTDGVYVEKLAADTSWFGVTRASSSQTRTAALVSVTTNWLRVRIRRVSATVVGFTLDNGAEVTATATIPTTHVQPFFAVYNNASGVDKSGDLDYFSLAISGLVR